MPSTRQWRIILRIAEITRHFHLPSDEFFKMQNKNWLSTCQKCYVYSFGREQWKVTTWGFNSGVWKISTSQAREGYRCISPNQTPCLYLVTPLHTHSPMRWEPLQWCDVHLFEKMQSQFLWACTGALQPTAHSHHTRWGEHFHLPSDEFSKCKTKNG